MLSLVGTTHWILNHGRSILLATAALLLLDACALRRDRALDRETAAHRSTEDAYQDARARLLGSDAFLLSERVGALRMEWRLYDTALPADSTGRHPILSEAIIESGETEKATLSESHLEASLSHTETSHQREENHEEKETERSETLRKATGILGGCSLIGLLILIGIAIIYIHRKRTS